MSSLVSALNPSGLCLHLTPASLEGLLGSSSFWCCQGDMGHGQGHLPLDQVAQSPVQRDNPKLKHNFVLTSI